MGGTGFMITVAYDVFLFIKGSLSLPYLLHRRPKLRAALAEQMHEAAQRGAAVTRQLLAFSSWQSQTALVGTLDSIGLVKMGSHWPKGRQLWAARSLAAFFSRGLWILRALL